MLIILFGVIGLISCNTEVPQKIKSGDDNSSEQKIKFQQPGSLYELYECCHRVGSSIECKLSYFDLFPLTFNAFRDSFAMEQKSYQKYEDMIPEFFNCALLVGDTVFSEKLIHICENGYADADAVGQLQFSLREYYKQKGKIISFLLDKKSSEIIDSFLFFLFDEFHPKTRELPEWFENQSNRYPSQIESARRIINRIYQTGDIH